MYESGLELIVWEAVLVRCKYFAFDKTNENMWVLCYGTQTVYVQRVTVSSQAEVLIFKCDYIKIISFF